MYARAYEGTEKNGTLREMALNNLLQLLSFPTRKLT